MACDAVEVIARYDTPDNRGETRRARNARFDMEDKSPDDIEPSDDWVHLWVWFWDLMAEREQSASGLQPLTSAGIMNWMTVSGERPSREDLAIIKAMDVSYRNAMSQEMEAQRRRDEARNK